jgi:hypothetical protein
MRIIALTASILVAALAADASQAQTGLPVCPPTVNVDTHVDLQGKPLPAGGWTDGRNSAHKLTSVAFYSGRRGEELKAAPAQLKPEQKEENKKMTESWSFAPSSPSLAICHYKGTEMTIGIELPPNVKSCDVVMTRGGTKSYHTAGTAVMSCK